MAIKKKSKSTSLGGWLFYALCAVGVLTFAQSVMSNASRSPASVLEAKLTERLQHGTETLDTGEINWMPGGSKRFRNMSSGNANGHTPSACDDPDLFRVLMRDAAVPIAKHRVAIGEYNSVHEFTYDMKKGLLGLDVFWPHEIKQNRSKDYRICEAHMQITETVDGIGKPKVIPASAYRLRYMTQYQNNVRTNVVAILYLVAY